LIVRKHILRENNSGIGKRRRRSRRRRGAARRKDLKK